MFYLVQNPLGQKLPCCGTHNASGLEVENPGPTGFDFPADLGVEGLFKCSEAAVQTKLVEFFLEAT